MTNKYIKDNIWMAVNNDHNEWLLWKLYLYSFNVYLRRE